MKNNFAISICFLSFFIVASVDCTGEKSSTSTTKKTPVIKDKRYDISAYGAVAGGNTLNTKAIQAVIDECAKKGGTVVIPKGEFLSGSIFLKPGVNLEIQEGGVLKGSTDINDYPKLMTRIEGHFEEWPAALLNGDKVDHLRITGTGTLDGSGQPFWKEFYDKRDIDKKTTNLGVPRPRLTLLQNSTDVKISGINYKNSGFWNLHLYKCQDLTVENCRFTALSGTKPNNAPSSDGIDVDCCQDITISKCFFSVGDDCIALKGTKGPFAMQDKDSPPVERIHILDCVFEAGGGIVTCGSEATIVRDVNVERCITRKPTVLRLKLRPDTPQQYENISLKDITMENGGVIFNIAPWSQYFDLKGQLPPKSVVRNITITNVKGTGNSSLGKIQGNPDTEFGEIILKNVDVQLKSATLELSEMKGLKFENVIVNGVPMATPAATPVPVKM
ncbi:glycoside hydrolase family 28 protein [Ferruginibacter sp. SUN106]|uniref:glycoside hydrolase family 28 protein n=1 Tax=Ferruginibacter sp. SUN106 TaxID=2978348 RepID=UPI003D35CC5A